MGLSSHQQSLFHGLIESARKQLPKLVVGSLLIGAGIAFYTNRVERINQLFLQPDISTAGIDEVSSNTKPLIRQIRKLPKRVKKLMEMIPYQEACSPVLGYLTAVILIGPYGLSIIHHVHETKAIAEFEVVFLMFNIGLELSVERLSTMKKYVFGLGSAQVLVTAVVVGLVSRFIAGQPSPAAIIIGDGLALSSTAVVLQVTVNEQLCKYCRNEVRACHAMDELHFLFCFPEHRSDPSKDTEIDSEKSKNMVQTKKQDLQKDLTREGSPFNAPKALLKKSSRFFSASYFFSDGTEFTPAIPFPWSY
ncbi:hypothetical protein TEA_011585 [Camellia sinensis var. sinensis]|uniref:Cation/H+ exchanger transmembrane domain-containing protein n=1 Tax=Camellia sinensis var. sinensis TaxID=542762 RepID=A0A4S4EGS9_CAMSN|nr:hypothetical protein TEA_011585 [Camellia sinensis var. sinensis]